MGTIMAMIRYFNAIHLISSASIIYRFQNNAFHYISFLFIFFLIYFILIWFEIKIQKLVRKLSVHTINSYFYMDILSFFIWYNKYSVQMVISLKETADWVTVYLQNIWDGINLSLKGIFFFLICIRMVRFWNIL